MKPLGFNFERKFLSNGYSFVVGCDEVGRGALAGPIVAAAVVWNAECKIQNAELLEVQDSKQLSATKRQELAFHIKHHARAWSVAEVSPQVIDKINIHQANLLALYRALVRLHVQLGYDKKFFVAGHQRSHVNARVAVKEGRRMSVLSARATFGKHKFLLPSYPETYVVVDGRFVVPQWYASQGAIVGGDGKIFSIAAASILAKVYRDQLMMKQDNKFPGYNFSNHKGYGTEAHRTAIAAYGLTPIHRRTFCTNLVGPE